MSFFLLDKTPSSELTVSDSSKQIFNVNQLDRNKWTFYHPKRPTLQFENCKYSSILCGITSMIIRSKYFDSPSNIFLYVLTEKKNVFYKYVIICHVNEWIFFLLLFVFNWIKLKRLKINFCTSLEFQIQIWKVRKKTGFLFVLWWIFLFLSF